ncbi:MAG: hypothetical protein HY901_20455 [Deltaproteobacteria bacterium]|nr:hypothetical protein [Deltaproteobacteria bacterium]
MPYCNQATGICAQASAPDVGPKPQDAGSNTDCLSQGCGTGMVCCQAPKACAGRCIADCRLGAPCPEQVPFCDQETGICLAAPVSGPDASSDCAATGCDDGEFCCLAPAACAGQCIADCRLGSACPRRTPICDVATGQCLAEAQDAGPAPPDAGPTLCGTVVCPSGKVCAPNNQCVPDCRIAECPPQHPTCIQATGLCQ